MIVRTYSGDATRELVITVVADSEPRLYRAHPVSAGGGWQIDTWRDDLIQALMDRQAMLGIGIRTAPADRVLPDQTWTDIAHRLSRHLGVLDSDKPWVAVRTGERTVVLLPSAPATIYPAPRRLPGRHRESVRPRGSTPCRSAIPIAKHGQH